MSKTPFPRVKVPRNPSSPALPVFLCSRAKSKYWRRYPRTFLLHSSFFCMQWREERRWKNISKNPPPTSLFSLCMLWSEDFRLKKMYKNYTTLPVSQTELYRVNAFTFPVSSCEEVERFRKIFKNSPLCFPSEGSRSCLRIHLSVFPVKVQEDL